jgi:hypothetical protein
VVLSKALLSRGRLSGSRAAGGLVVSAPEEEQTKKPPRADA